MSKRVIFIALVVILGGLVYFSYQLTPEKSSVTPSPSEQESVVDPQNATPESAKKEQACLFSGGTIETSSCCASVSDFPNLCLMGACGCSPDNSHEIKTCDCGEGKCFDGSGCVVVQ